MVLVALDSSLQKQSVAVFKRGDNGYELLKVYEQQASSSQFINLLAAIKPETITELAVITGPGSFTGIRTALTVAKTMATVLGIPVYAFNNFELVRAVQSKGIATYGCTKQAIALQLSERDYYVSLDTNYANPETNFYSAELAAGVKVVEAPNIAIIAEFLNHNHRAVSSDLQPYYLRMPNIGKLGESKISTKTGLKLNITQDQIEELVIQAKLAMTEARYADAEQLLKLYISKSKGIASQAPGNDVVACELLAEAELELGKLSSAKRHFLKAADICQAAFVALLTGKHQESRHLYLKAEDSIAKRWGLFLCDYLHPQHAHPIDSPGFMAFRLFLESTVSYMLRNKCETYVKVLLKNAISLETVFPELRKSIGSAYLGLKRYKQAAEIFQSAEATLAHDAELYYKLAEAQIGLDERVSASASLNTVLKLLPGHIGSEKLLRDLVV